jgi:hypothetical protein
LEFLAGFTEPGLIDAMSDTTPTQFRAPHVRYWLWPAVVLILIAVALSIWIPYYRETQLVAKIESWGGVVETYPRPDWLRDFVGEERLGRIKVLNRVTRVQLSETSVSDAEIVQLTELTTIEALYLDNTRVTDEGLAELCRLKNLVALCIAGTAVTDRGLAHLNKLKNLGLLDLSDTAVTDAGLSHLSGLTGLARLKLSRTAVSDEGLLHLRGLPCLCVLGSDGTRVTNEGIKDLEKTTALADLDAIHVWPFQWPEVPIATRGSDVGH